MRRTALLGALLVGKGLDALSTVVVLSVEEGTREAIPLSRAFLETFGLVGGALAVTALTVVVVAALAESGHVLERLRPGSVPEWYASTLQVAVYAGAAVWFAAVGLRNFALLL